MGTGHGKDKCISIDGYDVPGRRELLGLWRLVALFVETLFTRTNYCQYFLSAKIYFSDRMVFSVTQVDIVLILPIHVTKALRMMKLSLFVRSINKPNSAVSDHSSALHGLLIQDDQSIVSGVSHH